MDCEMSECILSQPVLLRLTLTKSKGSVMIGVIERAMYGDTVLKIGRSRSIEEDENRIELKSRAISRKHAKIYMLNGQVVLRDNTSSGGTYLNDKKISTSRSKSAPYALRNGDVVQLAKDHIGRSGEKHRCVIIKVEIYS